MRRTEHMAVISCARLLTGTVTDGKIVIPIEFDLCGQGPEAVTNLLSYCDADEADYSLRIIFDVEDAAMPLLPQYVKEAPDGN